MAFDTVYFVYNVRVCKINASHVLGAGLKEEKEKKKGRRRI